jgi:hypothetical protein
LILEAAPNLGFVTVVQEPGAQGGYLGGYLVTNSWGRPLEFRLSTLVTPNRVQQILYGSTLKPYIFADLIGKTLVERTAVPVQALFTDCEPLLELRLSLPTPVAWLAADGSEHAQSLEQAGGAVKTTPVGPLVCHPKFAIDVASIRQVLDQIDEAADLSEPFTRIKEALGEARKLGSTQRGS